MVNEEQSFIQNIPMDLIKKFYRYIWRHRVTFIVGSLLIIISQVLTNFGNYYVKYFFDVLNAGNINPFDIVNLIAGFIVINLLSMVFSLFAWTITDVYILDAGRKLKIEILSRLHDLDFSYHANKKSGSLISVIRRGDGAFFSFSHELNREILMIAVDFVFILVAFSGLNLILTGVVVMSVVIMLIMTRFLLSQNIKARTAFNAKEDQISGIIADNLINFETVKFFAKEKWEQEKLTNKFEEWYAKVWGYTFSFRQIEFATSTLIIFSMLAIFALSFQLYLDGQLVLSQLVLVITFAIRFYPQMFNLIFRLREIAKNHTDLEKYFAILDMHPEVKDPEEKTPLGIISGEIDFNNIVFSYNKKSKVLNGLDLQIKANESVALVGLSGAGKSTLVKLLLRFYDVDSGEIKLDGINIKDMAKSDLRSVVGIVPQEPVLFNDTVGYNIGYPKPGIDIDSIKEAARLSNLDDFIEALPEKYETEVGERGIKLSGGQKQRLAIARIFLADCPVMVFDEATSQLDSESEKLIQDALWKVAKNKTTIIIAHRLSTVMRADRIVVLDNGRVAEMGTHDELIKSEKGLYHKLWEMQKGGMLVD